MDVLPDWVLNEDDEIRDSRTSPATGGKRGSNSTSTPGTCGNKARQISKMDVLTKAVRVIERMWNEIELLKTEREMALGRRIGEGEQGVK